MSHPRRVGAREAAGVKGAAGCREDRRRDSADKCRLLLSSSREQVIDQSEDGAGTPSRRENGGDREVVGLESGSAATFWEISSWYLSLRDQKKEIYQKVKKLKPKWYKCL